MDTLRPRSQLLSVLGFILGSSWDVLWRFVIYVALIWDAKMGNSFQVHAFCDPGMEMVPECSGCMCSNHRKNSCFRETLIHEFGVPREGFRCHFGAAGCLGATFSHLLGSWGEA